MDNYNRFISNAKRNKLASDLIISVLLFIFVFAFFYVNFHIIFKICIVIFAVYSVLRLIYEIHKLNIFWEKLNIDERCIIEKELQTLFFEGVDYALTENYIIDLKKFKLIPIESILKIEKNYSLTTNSIDTSLETYVKIYTDKFSYKYLIKCRGLGFNISFGSEPYYKDLYNYIKFKNPNL